MRIVRQFFRKALLPLILALILLLMIGGICAVVYNNINICKAPASLYNKNDVIAGTYTVIASDNEDTLLLADKDDNRYEAKLSGDIYLNRPLWEKLALVFCEYPLRNYSLESDIAFDIYPMESDIIERTENDAGKPES